MTDQLALYPCPADMAAGEEPQGVRTCGRNFPSKNGAVMHTVNTDDGHHNQVADKSAAADHLVALSVQAGTPAPDPGGQTADTGSDGATADGGSTDAVQEPEIAPADGGTDHGSTGDDTENCPNCGADLDMTEQEIAEFIEENGDAYCPTCGYEVKVDE